MTLRVGICGYGQVARTRYLSLLDGLDAVVTAVADRSSEARSVAATHDPRWAVHDSLESMLGADEVDLVAVLTPGLGHADLVETCLRRGVHTYCEKPLAYRANRCGDLFGLADASGLALVCAPALGFAPALRSTGPDDETAATVAHASCVEPGPDRSPWFLGDPAPYLDPAARGCLYDLGVYGVDVLLHLFGADVRVVGAAKTGGDAGTPRPSWSALLQWPRGTVASLDVSWDGGGGAPEVTWYSADATSRLLLWGLAELSGLQRWPVDAPVPEPPPPDFAGPTIGWGLAWMVQEIEAGRLPSNRVQTCAVVDVLDRIWEAAS